MIITHFSDSHGFTKQIQLLQDSDILIFSGDCMTDGYSLFELKTFLNWFSEQKSEHKIMVAGNHDRLIQNMPSIIGAILKEEHPDIIYLENSGIEIEGIKFWGTPNQRHFYSWAFQNSDEELIKIFSKIPDDINILISHTPQYGILDLYKQQNLGDENLSKRIFELKDLKYHLVGHIHDNWGIDKTKEYTTINSALLNNNYFLRYKPIKFEYET